MHKDSIKDKQKNNKKRGNVCKQVKDTTSLKFCFTSLPKSRRKFYVQVVWTPLFWTRINCTNLKKKKKVDLALDHEQIKATQEKQNSKKQLLRPQKSGHWLVPLLYDIIKSVYCSFSHSSWLIDNNWALRCLPRTRLWRRLWDLRVQKWI